MALDNVNLTSGMRSTLLSLQNTANLIDRSFSHMATGVKIASPLDDAIVFFWAQENLYRVSDLTLRKDEMNEAIQAIKAAKNGTESILSMLGVAKSIAQSALIAETGTEISGFAEEYNEILNQINYLRDDPDYNGINLLAGTSQILEIVFDEHGDSKITITGFDSSSAGLGLNTLDVGSAAVDDFRQSLNELETAKSTLQTEMKYFSNSLDIISVRQEFTSSIVNTLKEGADQLTLADLDEEGANILMLQARKKLGSLSMALSTQAAQGVLRIFDDGYGFSTGEQDEKDENAFVLFEPPINTVL